MKVFVYEVTASAHDAPVVGSCIVDTEEGPAEEWDDVRIWTFYSPADGFVPGFTGVKTDRACKACFRAGFVRPHKHEGAHGDGPHLVPTRTGKESVL